MSRKSGAALVCPEAFARKYGFALSAVRDWEQGRRRPDRSARILLKIVEREPEAGVTRALQVER